MRRLFLSSACAMAVFAIAAPTINAADAAAEHASTSPLKATPEWVRRSNEIAQPLLKAQATFSPEFASFFGPPGYDEFVADFRPDNAGRLRSAIRNAKGPLEEALKTEEDPNVRQDIGIMISAADRQIEGSELDEKLLLPFTDIGELVFRGEQSLLQDQVDPARRPMALVRLKAYVGLTPGTTPIMTLVRQRYEEKLSDASLLKPTKLEVEQALRNAQTYAAGVRQLFGKYKIAGADAALAALDEQTKAYADWMKTTVLPSARTDTRLPPELYAFRLKQVGIDIPPEVVVQRAQLEFMETRAAMQQLAPLVAKAKGIDASDYQIGRAHV